MIRAVLWDFGGVLTTSPFAAFNRFEDERGLPRDFIRRVNAADPDDNAWARLERSEVGLAEFSDLFEAESRALGHAVRGEEVLRLLHGEVRPAMVEALRRCRERLLCACLTNNFVAGTEEGGTYASERAPAVAEVMALFHLVIESSKAGVRKPDPRFYRMACERLGVAPEDSVFLDDLGVNLKPARAMGITTIKVADPAAALAELERAVGFALV